MFDSMKIEPTSMISDVIQKHPTTAGVFNYFGIDACCGGHSTVGNAAADEFVDAESLVVALRAAVRYETAVSAMSSYEQWRSASHAFDARVNAMRG
jgi:iron-sulfur cluster repair protein YtfE (RIC family)